MFRNSTNKSIQEKIKCLAQEPDCGKNICNTFEWSECFSFQEVWLRVITLYKGISTYQCVRVQETGKTSTTVGLHHSTLVERNEKRHSPKSPKCITNLTLCQVINEAAMKLTRACLQIRNTKCCGVVYSQPSHPPTTHSQGASKLH